MMFSGISSPTTLAVSLCIDSLSSPDRVPSFLCNVSCAVGDLTIMRPILGLFTYLLVIDLSTK